MTGLGGHGAEHTATVWLVAVAFGLLAIAALIAIYRRAVKQRELEEAERAIEEAFRDRS